MEISLGLGLAVWKNGKWVDVNAKSLQRERQTCVCVRMCASQGCELLG